MSKKNGKGSLKYQIIRDLDRLQCYGQSKHQAKLQEKERCEAEGIKYNGARVQGIYSIKTYDTYKNICLDFGKWAKAEYNVKNLEQLKQKEYVKAYLEHLENMGRSVYSLRTYGAALSKLCRCISNEFGYKFQVRTRDSITRSRTEKFHDSEINLDKYSDITKFCKGTGLRRGELTYLNPQQIYEKNNKVYICFNKELYGPQTKAGRDRVTEVIEAYQDHIIAMRDKAIDEGRSTVFPHIPNRLDEHSYRREFATAKYNQIIEHREELGILRLDYHTRDGSHRHLDKEALREVSKDLGHNRIDVVVKHYLD